MKTIFIVGVGRSGTTLIQSMLNAHSKISFLPETHFIRNYMSDKNIQKQFNSNNLNYIKKRFKNDKNINKLNNNMLSYLNDELSKSNNLSDLFKRMLQQYLKNHNKIIVGEKDPKNLEYLNQIIKTFPHAKILHIIRDPRDVVLSRLNAEWSKDRGLITHALTYRFQYLKAQKDGKEIFKSNYLEFRYEELITKPESMLNDICQFLKIKYDKNMLKFYENSSEIIKGEEKKWKDNCFKPINVNNLNKWKNKLSKNQIYLIEKICAPVFTDNKYDLSNQNKVKLKYKILLFFINLTLPIISITYYMLIKYKYIKVKKYL